MLKNDKAYSLVEGIEALREQFDPISICKGLYYASDQLRLYGNEIEDDTELRCAVNNLHSITEAMYFLACLNELAMKYEFSVKGGAEC